MSLFYKTTYGTNINDVISKNEDKTFKSPFRSTLPLLSWVKHEFSDLLSMLSSFHFSTNCDLHFEFEVEPPKE
jgi:hypothetical protein